MPDDFEDMDMVAWRVEQGRPDPHNPLVEPKMPWDLGAVLSCGTVLRDPIDGKWKAWQISTPPATREPKNPGIWYSDRRLTYLDSDDGVRWRRPELTVVKWPGYGHTNILIDMWCGYASVNIDPGREWPYEMFMLLNPASRRAGPMDAPTGLAGMPPDGYGVYRLRSKNGTRWEIAAGPLDLATSDSCYLFRFGERYVAYHKTGLPAFPGGLAPYDIGDGDVRIIGRRTSSDGIHWSDPPELVLTPDWRDPADTQFMELNPVEFPGGYIAIVTVFHDNTQSIDLQWAARRDGVNWWRPDRRPALPNLPLGDYGGSMIWPMRSPVIDGRQLFVYYAGSQTMHGDLFNTLASGPRPPGARGEAISRQPSSVEDYSALCRANWRADRLWALAPAGGLPYVGKAVTKVRSLGGTELLVSVATQPGGELRVELLDKEGRTLPGFAAADCQAISGDQDVAIVHWANGSIAPADAAKVRFLLRGAYVYGFDTPPL